MMLARLRTLLFGTLRRQLVLGVALVHAVLMAGFVWDLTQRERDMLTENQVEHAQALAQSLATSSAGWVAARDLAGLREIVEAQRRYPELAYAMILDRDGKVLAHSDAARRGQFVRDLPATAQTTLLASSPALVDAVAPVLLAGRHVGWGRVGLAQETSRAKLAEITRDGLLYALAAILFGSIMAWFMARGLTRRLAVIQNVADAVEHGDLSQRATLTGTDEASRLAAALDSMLDSLIASHSALADSEQRLLMAFDAAAMVAWRWQPDSSRTSWGAGHQVEWMLGPRPPEGYADFVEMVVPEDRESFIAAGRAALAGTGDYLAEFRLRRTDGQVRWLLARGRVMRGTDGRATAILGISQDITERRQNEEQLRKLSLAVEQSPNCIIITDLDGSIEYVNAACARISGYEAGELLGQNPRIQQSGKTPRETYVAMWAALSRGQSWEGELINRRKDGGEYTEFTYIIPLRQPDGRVMHYVAIKQDITEQKRLTEEIERHREHLEERVAERTAELTVARNEAERLARAKSEFLANMSHELRTPLNGVLGMARIGARDSVGRASHEIFVHIQDSGAHLLGVINDILDFSKLDAGKLVVERRPFALAAAIDNAVSFVSGAAREKGLAFEITVTADLPEWVSGDVQRLQQILVNLLSNAVKFTARGEVRLRVAGNGDDIWFKVIDTGIGMSEAQAARLFQPFEQADSSTTRKYGGTGLGLAISRNLARLMGGEITGDCAPGAGCSFTLRLPLPRVAPHLPAHVVDPAASVERRLAGLRLLAADDVEVNRLILEDLLSHEGAHVIFAGDGQQALDRLEEAGVSAFDAVLMDVQMPVMNGLEATRHLRAMAPALPVIGLTAHAFAEERDKCFAAGMVEHVTKPIDPDLLVAAILRHARPTPAEPVRAVAGPAAPVAVPPAPTVTADLVDWPALLAQYSGREAFVAKLAAIAVNSQQETVAKLRTAAAQGDREALAFIAHSLKGVAGNLMARGVRDLAARTEAAARLDEPQATSLAIELAAAMEALLDELARRRPQERN